MPGKWLFQIAITSFLLAYLLPSAKSQNVPYLGVGGGGNITHFTGSRWTVGYQAPLVRDLSWRSSLNYIRKVNDYPFFRPDMGVDNISIHSDYVQFEIGVQAAVFFEKTALFFTAGPYTALANAHRVRSLSEDPPVKNDELDLLSWEWGVYLESGVRKNLNARQSIFTSFRWEVGMQDIISNYSFSLRNDDKLITLGMLFVLTDQRN